MCIHKGPGYMHKVINPEQIIENPNFKPLLVVKEWPILMWFLCRTKYICMYFTVTTEEINQM